MNAYMEQRKKLGTMAREAMVGKTFNYLTVISDEGIQDFHNERRGLLNCLCVCGEYRLCRQDHLNAGLTKSCGCENIVKTFIPDLRYETGAGYIQIRIPNWRGDLDEFHQGMVDRGLVDNTGMILEHRYNYMMGSGKYIDYEDTVHHINGKRDDNSYENLEHWTGNHLHGVRKEDMDDWVLNYIEEHSYLKERIIK